MKKIILCLFSSIYFLSVDAQTCAGTNQLTLLGKKDAGIFYQLHTNATGLSNGDVSQGQLCVAAWTCNSQGVPNCNFREYFKYKLSQIPTNAVVVSANLYLYAKINSTLGIVGSPTYGTDNAVSISRVITPWDTSGIGFGWGNQPATTNENQVILPTSTSTTQDYVADLKNLVQFWVNNPDSNFGMKMKIINETYYKSMIFHSGTSVDAVKPRLEICYWTEEQFPKVWGYTYYDANNNGTKDSAEFYTPYTKIQLSNGAFTFSDVNGYYEISSSSLGNYTLDVTAPNFYTSSNLSTSYSFTSFGQQFQNDVPFVATSNTDSINIHITPFHSFARPGFGFPCYVDYENLGNTVLLPVVSVGFNSYKQTYDSCSVTNFVNNGNSFGGLVGSINPGERHYFIGYLTTQPTVTVADTIQLTAIASAGTAIAIDAASVPVRASFDPNDKEATAVLSPAQVAAGKYIDYTIRFENVGNDTAFTVVIKDSLSNLLQANTLQMISSSHACKATVRGRFVKFEFKNIKLLYHSLNEFKSMGFVKFRVKPLATLVNGNTVSNKASIYFDFNEPIVTNTAFTKISNVVVTPVKLERYEVRGINNKQVVNTWKTATEVNTSYFNIQRSVDANPASQQGRYFETIGKVNAGKSEYQYIDNSLPLTVDGKLYYRLEMVDKDGSKTYSQIKTINLNQLANKQVNVYPNPATNTIIIERVNTAKENISIVDMYGKKVMALQLVNAIQTINISKLPSGVYMVCFDNGDKLKVIKE